MKRTRIRTTPALWVAVVSLVVAASGVGYAAGSSSTVMIVACVHHSGGGLYIAKKCALRDHRLSWNTTGPQGEPGSAGTAGTPGTPGTPGTVGATGPTGAAGTTLFAQIKDSGAINASSAGVTATLSGSNYYINFGRNITHCSAVAQEGDIPLFSGGSQGGSPPETAQVVIGDGSGSYTTGFPEDDTVNITTYVSNGNNAPLVGAAAFYLTVTC